MAKVKYNVVTHGLSGLVGDLLVFSQRNGKTYVGKPSFRDDAQSVRQLAVREKFIQAAQYAKACISDPSIKEIYAEHAGNGLTEYNLAFADFFKAPKVGNIESDTYTGAVGSTINVLATDDTKVKNVQFRILSSDSSVLEEGAAVKQADTDNWIYTATMSNASLTGSKIIVEARDLPGNLTTAEKVL